VWRTYDQFKPGDTSLALPAAFISLLGTTLPAASSLKYAPLLILNNGIDMSAFRTGQVQAF
jgi:hypothetical protein